MNERQPVPLGKRVELREILETGEVSIVLRKRKDIPRASYIQRIRALNQWKGESNFELVFAAGAQAYPEAEAAKIAIMSGINTNFDDAIGYRDDAESALREMFDPQLTRFKLINSVDLTRLMKTETARIKHKLHYRTQGLQAYLERAIEIMGEARGLSLQTVANLKDFSR